MSKQVKQVIDEHICKRHCVNFAIHQNKNECVAIFLKFPEGHDRDGEVIFKRWNDEVKNKTGCHSENDLLNAYVYKVWNVSDDWFCIEVLPF